jgi:hypothetical protein
MVAALALLATTAGIAMSGFDDGAAAAAAAAAAVATATTCLRWSAAVGDVDSAAPLTAPAAPGPFCRVVSMDTLPMGVSIGRYEMVNGAGPYCFFTGKYPGRRSYRDYDLRNGTALPGQYQRVIGVQENCAVNFTAVDPGAAAALPADAVVGGFTNGSMLGLCISAPIGPHKIRIQGQLYLSGTRAGQCCYSSGYKEHCDEPGEPYLLARFYARPKAAPSALVGVRLAATQQKCGGAPVPHCMAGGALYGYGYDDPESQSSAACCAAAEAWRPLGARAWELESRVAATHPPECKVYGNFSVEDRSGVNCTSGKLLLPPPARVGTLHEGTLQMAAWMEAAQPPVKNVSATTCLVWSALDTQRRWLPAGQGGGGHAVCRAIALGSLPPSISIGKLEGAEAGNTLSCYFPELNFSSAPPNGANRPRNGSAHNDNKTVRVIIEVASISPRCTVNFSSATVHLAHARTGDGPAGTAFPSNSLVAGMQADGSLLGVCLPFHNPTGAPHEGAFTPPGTVFLTGPRRGACCWDWAEYGHCYTDPSKFKVAVFYEGPPPFMPPPPPPPCSTFRTRASCPCPLCRWEGQTGADGHCADPPPPYGAKTAHVYSTLFTATVVNTMLATRQQVHAAVAFCRNTTITKVYLESYRSGVRASSALLTQARSIFEAAGLTVHGCVCTTGLGQPSDGWSLVSDYLNVSTQMALEAEFTFAAQHFDELIIDDFYFTDDQSQNSLAALNAGSVTIWPTAAEPSALHVKFSNTSDLSQGGAPCKWKDMRRTLLLHTGERDIVAAARAVKSNVKVTLKYPNWYDSYQDMGYDVVAETAVFDHIWVGTETRDYYDVRWGGNPAYHGCFLMRWFQDLTACDAGGKFATRGGWFDTLGTQPPSYIEQARQTILGGATESFLFEASALMTDTGTGMRDAAALRLHMNELQRVASEVQQRTPIGIAAYKPPNSHSGYDSSKASTHAQCSISGDGNEQALFSFVGMLGLPLLPVTTFPDLTYTGVPLNRSIPGAALFSMHSLKDPLLPRKLAAYVKSGRPTLVTDHLAEALKDQLDLSTATNVHLLAVGKSPAAMLAQPPQKLRELRSAMLAGVGRGDITLWQAPTNFISLHPFSDGSWVLENFANYTVSAEVSGVQHIVPARGWSYEWKK